jgi:hypothetical protein
VKVDIFFDTPIGVRLFRVIGRMYFMENGHYPTTLCELPAYINQLGFKCSPQNIKPPIAPIERCGITLEEEVATALVLRFG